MRFLRKTDRWPPAVAATLLFLFAQGLCCTPPAKDARTAGDIAVPAFSQTTRPSTKSIHSSEETAPETENWVENDHVVEVARKASMFGEIIVFDQGGYRCLAFNDYENLQSCVSLARKLDFRFEYIKMMFVTSLAVDNLSRVLILGLGGGSLPRLFAAVYPDTAIDVVEIDPAVVKAAQKYMGYKAAKNTRLHILDAAEFVKKRSSKNIKAASGFSGYDLILVDCYDDKDIPAHLLSKGFVRNLASIANPGGIIAVNLAMDAPHYTTTVVRYSENFTGIWLMRGIRSGNHIFGFGNHFPDRDTMNRRAAEADKKLLFSSKNILETFGYPRHGPKPNP